MNVCVSICFDKIHDRNTLYKNKLLIKYYPKEAHLTNFLKQSTDFAYVHVCRVQYLQLTI